MRPDLVYGRHAAAAVLDGDISGVKEVWLQEGHRQHELQALLQSARAAGISVHEVPKKTLDRLTGGVRHQGIALACRGARPVRDLSALLDSLAGPALLLVLDGVQDPHNLGACLRSADAAGAHGLVMPRDRAVGLTPTVRNVASGAAENLPVVEVGNLAQALRTLQARGIFIMGTASDAPASLYETDLSGPAALVLGAEGKGLRRLTREHCDLLVRIPMAGRVASLNVSVAAALCLFEAARQRLGSVATASSMA